MTLDPPALRRADWVRPAERKQTLSQPKRAAEELAALAAGLEPGERLGSKDKLRRHCGVSVGTFNEALRLVQSRGVVTVRPGPGGGLFATRQSPMVRLGNSMLALDEDATSVADAVRLRDAIDPLLVEDALLHACPHHIRTMRLELEHMAAAAESLDGTAFVHANWALHARIADVSPSAVVRSLYLSLLDIIESHTLSVQADDEHTLPEYIRSRYELHTALVDAIADRDAHGALALIHQHNTTGHDPGLELRRRDSAANRA